MPYVTVPYTIKIMAPCHMAKCQYVTVPYTIKIMAPCHMAKCHMSPVPYTIKIMAPCHMAKCHMSPCHIQSKSWRHATWHRAILSWEVPMPKGFFGFFVKTCLTRVQEAHGGFVSF